MLFTRSLPSLNVIRFVAFFYIRFREDQCLRSKARFIFNMMLELVCLFVHLRISMPHLFIIYNWGVVHTCMSGGQRTCGIGFLCIVWVPGIRLKLSDLTASDSPTESPGPPRAFFLKRQGLFI